MHIVVNGGGGREKYYSLLFFLKFSFERKSISSPLSKKTSLKKSNEFLFPHVLEIVLLLTTCSCLYISNHWMRILAHWCHNLFHKVNDEATTEGVPPTVTERGVFCKGQVFSSSIDLKRYTDLVSSFFIQSTESDIV